MSKTTTEAAARWRARELEFGADLDTAPIEEVRQFIYEMETSEKAAAQLVAALTKRYGAVIASLAVERAGALIG